LVVVSTAAGLLVVRVDPAVTSRVPMLPPMPVQTLLPEKVRREGPVMLVEKLPPRIASCAPTMPMAPPPFSWLMTESSAENCSVAPSAMVVDRIV